MVNVFSIPAFFIVLREVLEACLVVGIVLAYLNKTGEVALRKHVWGGAALGIVLSGVVGIAFTVVYYTREEQLFSGKSEYIFEGIAFLFAAGLLTWMILWMLKMGHSIKEKLENKVDVAIEAGSAGRAAWGIFAMVFLQVLREGIETFIFLFGAAASDGGVDRDAWKGVILPGLLGLVVGLAVAYLVFRGMVTLDIQAFFLISSIVLMAFAAGLVSHGLHELQEADWLGPYETKNGETIGSIDRDWFNAKMWSTAACCNDKTNEFFAMLRALFGYQDTPSFIEFASYFAYWFVVLGVLAWMSWKAIRAARNKTARYARGCATFALLSFFIGFIYVCMNFTWTGLLTTLLGLVLAIGASIAVFDLVSEAGGAGLAALRKPIALACAVGLALYTLLVSVLHIVQMHCVGKSCQLPKFFYWGLIFEPEWAERGNTGSSWNTIAVLSVSFVFSVFFFTIFSVLMYLYSGHLGGDGAYIYEDMEKLPTKGDEALADSASSEDRMQEPLAV